MKKILIVAGHGSGDPGAVGNGYEEADLTREFGKILTKYVKGATLYNTSRNLYADGNIGSISKNYDEVIELHFNAAGSTSANGTEVLISGGQDKIDESILDVLNDYFTNRGIKIRNDLYNMNNSNCAYRLVEICFISNANDVKIYKSKKEEMAKKIGDRINKITGNSSTSNNKPSENKPTQNKPSKDKNITWSEADKMTSTNKSTGARIKKVRVSGSYVSDDYTFGHSRPSVSSSKVYFKAMKIYDGYLLDSEDGIVWFEITSVKGTKGEKVFLDLNEKGKKSYYDLGTDTKVEEL